MFAPSRVISGIDGVSRRDSSTWNDSKTQRLNHRDEPARRPAATGGRDQPPWWGQARSRASLKPEDARTQRGSVGLGPAAARYGRSCQCAPPDHGKGGNRGHEPNVRFRLSGPARNRSDVTLLPATFDRWLKGALQDFTKGR